MQTKPIVITGATGKTGSRIAQRLESRGYDIRRASRNAEYSFDWERPETWHQTLTGASAVYICFYPDFGFPGALDTLSAFTETANQAGIERLVMITGRGEPHAQGAEAILHKSEIPTTILRSAWFAQNFSEGALRDAILDGILPMPGGDVQEPIVDIEDFADVAVAVLTEENNAGKTYEITGPRLMTFAEMARSLSDLTGKPIHYIPTSFEQFHAELEKSAGSLYADIVTDIARETLDGRNATVADGVDRILGRPARDFTQFVLATAKTDIWTVAV